MFCIQLEEEGESKCLKISTGFSNQHDSEEKVTFLVKWNLWHDGSHESRGRACCRLPDPTSWNTESRRDTETHVGALTAALPLGYHFSRHCHSVILSEIRSREGTVRVSQVTNLMATPRNISFSGMQLCCYSTCRGQWSTEARARGPAVTLHS